MYYFIFLNSSLITYKILQLPESLESSKEQIVHKEGDDDDETRVHEGIEARTLCSTERN